MLNTKVRKIGGSLGVILPAQALAAVDVTEGTELDVRFDGRRIVLAPRGAPTQAEFLKILDKVMAEDDAILRELAK